MNISVLLNDKTYAENDGYKVVSFQLKELCLSPDSVKRVVEAYNDFQMYCSFWCYCNESGHAVIRKYDDDGWAGEEITYNINGDEIIESLYRCSRCNKKYGMIMA